MGRRRELRNIANGLIGSFVSRNNDQNGYWGLGLLYEFANLHKTDTVQLSLLSNSDVETKKEFSFLISLYKSRLVKHLSARNIDINCVKDVFITSKFNQESNPKYHYWGSGLGDPCVCTCEIIDDNGEVIHDMVGNGPERL